MRVLFQNIIAAVALLCAGMLPATGRAQGSTDEQILIDRAKSTVDSFIAQADMADMRRLLARSRAVIVFPQILKAGFIVGGEGGSGVLLARDPKTGAWTAPAFFTLGAASVGLQIGAEATEVMLLIMNDRALGAMIDNQVKLGADASIAAGPIGKGVEASTTTALNRDIYSFARSRGLFGGVSLEGAVVKSRDDLNQRYYGKAFSARQITIQRQIEAPAAAQLQQSLARAETK